MNENPRTLLFAVSGVFIAVLLLLGVAATRPMWDPTADSGNDGNGRGQGQGQGREQAPGQNKDKDKDGNGRGNGQGQGRDQAPGKNKDKTPEIDVELSGTVESVPDDEGRSTFTMTVDGTTWELSAGPKWYWGDDNPLVAAVGRAVVVAGSHHEGESELSVATIDGTAIREPGKPPWAGGPKDKQDKDTSDSTE